jgi:hypothetical protein
MTLNITTRVRLQLRLGRGLVGWFHGYTHRLEMASLTLMFLEFGWIRQRADYPCLPE